MALNTLKQTLNIRYLGCVDYASTLLKMRDFTVQRTAACADEFWVLEHWPVFTLGQASREAHLLARARKPEDAVALNSKYSASQAIPAAGDIPVIHSDRGGQVTYHGPGQLVIYPLVDIQRLGINVRDFVSLIEQLMIDTLHSLFALDSYAKRDAPGVYIQDNTSEAKIGSLGLRIKNGASYHGLSLNIDMNLRPFSAIDPCGFKGLRMTQVRQLLADASTKQHPSLSLQHVAQALTAHYVARLKERELAYSAVQHIKASE